MSYDNKQKWIDGKRRILDILNSSNDIEECKKVPTEQEFNFENGYYAWVTAGSSWILEILHSCFLIIKKPKQLKSSGHLC